MRVRWDEAETGGDAVEMVPERTEIAPDDQWDLTPLFNDSDAWEAEFARLDALTAPLEAMRGTLDSPETVAELCRGETELDRLIERLYVYARQRADEDTRDNASQTRDARIRAKLTDIAGRLAWITPEILSHDEETLRAWADDPALADYRYTIVKLARRKPHTLSDKEETLLSRAGEIFGASRQTFNFLTNADMTFPPVEDAEGKLRELSQGRFVTFLQSGERRVRREAFEALYGVYQGHRNTLASTLSATVKTHNYLARTRHFDSALAASLHDDQIPVALYETLIEATREALPRFHEYVALRRRRLGLDDLDMYDMYVPIVPDFEMTVPFEQAREWVEAACAPLGDEYVAALRSGFDARWIDRYENRGKRSGAYSSGCYDSPPYILMNYQATLDDVFTLAHELGHSLHSWLANHTQPPQTADYPIFIAEIASTLNEALLLRHLLDTSDDPRLRAYLLNHLCDAYKGTVFRQTMFAEFEKRVHELDDAGQPLTPDTLCGEYYELNSAHYGPRVDAHRRIEMEWSRIPHFYYNFYVYKYATSFCASQIFARRVVENDADRGRYLDLLRAGGSADPLDLVARAGVDMTRRGTYAEAFEGFSRATADLEEALAALDRL